MQSTRPIYLDLDIPEIGARRGDYLVRRPDDPAYPAVLMHYIEAPVFDRLATLIQLVAPPHSPPGGGAPPPLSSRERSSPPHLRLL